MTVESNQSEMKNCYIIQICAILPFNQTLANRGPNLPFVAEASSTRSSPKLSSSQVVNDCWLSYLPNFALNPS